MMKWKMVGTVGTIAPHRMLGGQEAAVSSTF